MKKRFIAFRKSFIRRILGMNNISTEQIKKEPEVEIYCASPVLLNRTKYRNSLRKINIDLDN